MSCVVSSNWLEYAVILKASLLMWGVGLLSYQVYVCFYDAFWCTICCLCRFVRWSVAKISDVSCFAFTQWFYHTLFTMAPLLSLYFIVFSSPCFQNVHIVLLFALFLFLLYISAVQIYHVSQLSLLLLLQPAAGRIYVHVTWYACRGLRVQN